MAVKTAEQILADLNKVLIGPATGPSRTAPADYGAWALGYNPVSPGAKSSGGGTPLWQRALSVLDRPRNTLMGAVLESMNTTFKPSFSPDAISKSFNGPFWQSLTGKQHTSFEDVLNKAGWQDQKGKVEAHDIVGTLGDLILDPINLVTLGGGSALKAGASATLKAAEGFGAKTAGDAALKTFEATRNQLVNKGINPDLAERFAINKAESARTTVQGAGSAARAKAQNALFNIDIPFTKLTKQIGTKPGFLTKKATKIGNVGVARASEILAKLGAKTPQEQSALLKRMGIDAPTLDKMNIQQFDHLQNQSDMAEKFLSRRRANDGKLKNNLRDFNLQDQVVGKNEFVNYQPFKAEDFLNQLDPRIAARLAPFVQGLQGNVDQLRKTGPEAVSMFGEALGKMPGTIKGKTADAIKVAMNDAATKIGNVDNIAHIVEEPITAQKLGAEIPKNDFQLPKSFDQFIQDMGGRSKLGDTVGRVTDAFNPRTLGVKGEGVVNDAANKVRDAEGVKYAGMRHVDKVVGELKQATKDFTLEEKRAVEYSLENKFPDGVDPKSIVTQRVKDAVAKLRPIYKEIANAESRRGLLKDTISGYAPHVLQPNVDELLQRAEKYASDDAFSKLVAKGTANQFSKKRTSFQSFAELDNAIYKLNQSLFKTNDPNAINEIQDKIDILSNLFNRDPIDALGKRYAKSIKIRAMKDLQDQLRKGGLIKAAKNAASTPESARVAGQFVELDKAQAAALNMPERTVIHKDVLKALQKIEEVFTNEGANKVLHTFENVQSILKSLYTTYIPSHYWNNFTGNVMNNMLAGVGIGSYREASKLMKAVRKGKATSEQGKLYQSALENGILHQGFSSDFIPARQNSGKFAKNADWMYNNKVAKTIRNKAGDPSDNFTRLALFLHGMKQTGSTKHSADLVRKHLFSYHEMTGADRIVRTFVPFWNWTKNNVPLQIEKLMQQPRFYADYMKLKNASQNDGNKKPGFIQDSFFHVPGTDKTYYDPHLPLSDLNGPLGGGLDAIKFGVNSLTPFAKVPFEVVTNRNTFTGSPIDYKREYGQGFDPQAWAKYGLGQLGKGGRTLYDAANGDGTNILDAITNLINPFGRPVTLR